MYSRGFKIKKNYKNGYHQSVQLVRGGAGCHVWQAELSFNRFFQISKIIILDIKKTISDIRNCILDIQNSSTVILDIRNSYFGYPIYLFWISRIINLDIQI